MTKLNISLPGLNLKNPIIPASGTCGFGEELSKLYDLSLLGGICIKATTKEKRLGNPTPRVCEVYGGMLNAIGLANPGIDDVISNKLPLLKQYNTEVSANIAGNTIEDYVEVARRLSEDESIKGTMLRLLKIIIASIIIIFVCMTALNVYNNANTTIDKPIIYLYPQEDTDVTVNLQYSNNITVSYPKYNPNIGWHILAKPDGNLIDLSTKKNLYSLYYESKSVIKPKIEKDGFVIKGSDASSFLEEKLAVLGLSERESEEFIIYWLPKLEHNKYNYIRFATIDEINNNMPLSINPNPDTLIRVLMTYKGLNSPINVEKQKLDTPERNGFVVVEWGGTMIN